MRRSMGWPLAVVWFLFGMAGMSLFRNGFPHTMDLPVLAGTGGTIAFSTPVEGLGQEIAVMRADGSGRVAISGHPGIDIHPAWSPDGERIAFSSYREGRWNLVVMDRDGKNARIMAEGGLEPAWSPDGCRIAFSRHIEGGNQDIFTIGVDGADEERITDNPGFDGKPTWSPDGRRLAMQSDRFGTADIIMVDTETKGVTRLTDDPGNEASPAWSPDGKWICHVSDGVVPGDDPMSGKNTELVLIGANGKGARVLTDSPGVESYPAWSPDSRRIVYGYGDERTAILMVTDIDGRHTDTISSPDFPYDYGPASWSIR